MSVHVMRVKFAGGKQHESGIETIALANGRLLVNGSIVDCEARNGFRNWVRTHADGAKEFGSLKISMGHGMCMARGVVLFNGRETAFSAASMIEYGMTIEGPDGKEPWYSLAMGFVENKGGILVPTSQLLVGGDEDASELLQSFSQVILGTKASHLIAAIDIDLDFCYTLAEYYPNVYSSSDITFSLDYQTLSGQAYKYLSGTSSARDGDAYAVTGEARSSSLLTMIRGIVQDMPVLLDGQRQVGGHNASDADFLVAASLQSDLTVAELFSLPAPDMEKLHEYSFDKLRTLMLYAIDDDTRHFFQENKPEVGRGVLKQSDVDLLRNRDIEQFMVKDFSIGYLTEAFSKSDNKEIKDDFKKIPNLNEKMSYFWTGDGATSFSKSKGYNLAMSSIMDNTFGEFVPGLAPYKSHDPEGWARALYEYCTEDKTVFNGLALQTAYDQQGRVTQLSSILHALDPKPRLETKIKGQTRLISYSTALHQQVVNRQLFEVTKNTAPMDEVELENFLIEFFKLEFASLLADDTWQGKVNGQAREDLDKLMKEFNVDTTNGLVVEMSKMIADSAQFLVANRKTPVCNRINNWAKDKQWAAGFGPFLTMGVYGFAIFSMIQAFMNWDKLAPAQKKIVVKNVVAVTANIFSDVAVWLAARTLTTIEAKAQALMDAGLRINNAVQVERATLICERIGVQLEIEMPEMGAAGLAMGGAEAANDMMRLEELGAAAAKWEKIALVSSKLAKTLTMAAMGAACVAGGYQIAHDFATGQPPAVVVFDILGTVATGIAFLVEAGSGLAALCGYAVVSVVPMIGVVAAIVGIVAAFVGLFLHRNKPLSPAQQFVRDKSTPFVNRLAMPSKEWLEEQRKKDAHLENPAAPLPLQSLAV